MTTTLRIAALASILLLSACAGGPPAGDDPGLKSQTSTSGEETAERTRARVHTELAASYYVFVDAGCDVTIASPRGGAGPLGIRLGF